jgi:hypothetical protein
MSKVIGVIILAVVIYGGYEVWVLWDKYNTGQDLKEQESKQGQVIPEQLAGMPNGLEKTYQMAQKNGATGVRNWLKAYGARVEDPRRAWIELDYVVLIAREDPVEAKKVFADVKSRTPETSPVYRRIKDLQKTYE